MKRIKHITFILILLNFAFRLTLANEAMETENKDLMLEAKQPTENIDFTSIKDLIKKDGLDSELQKKQAAENLAKELKRKKDKERFDFPDRKEFMSFFYEYFLVKNAPRLKWDFQKPDFGLEEAYEKFLTERGFVEIGFKILLIDSTEIYRLSYFDRDGVAVHLLSLPFIRMMDLSKVEISMLLFEDYLRLRRDYLNSKLVTKDIDIYFGTNFSGKKFPQSIFEKFVSDSSETLFNKGFNFQEQFEVTKEMDQILKTDLKIWNTYLTLLGKIDQLTKNNTLYKKYAEYFPSPEMQIKWIQPTEKKF